MLKSTNPNNYKMIKAIAELFCNEKYNKIEHFIVFFEHGQFWMKVETEAKEDTFSVVDSECLICQGETTCFNCGSNNGISFELIDSIELE